MLFSIDLKLFISRMTVVVHSMPQLQHDREHRSTYLQDNLMPTCQQFGITPRQTQQERY